LTGLICSEAEAIICSEAELVRKGIRSVWFKTPGNPVESKSRLRPVLA